MEPSDIKSVQATVCNACGFARPLVICVRMCCSFMCAVCGFASVRVCAHVRKMGKGRRGRLLMIISEGDCVCVYVTEFAPT